MNSDVGPDLVSGPETMSGLPTSGSPTKTGTEERPGHEVQPYKRKNEQPTNSSPTNAIL